jgi:hypothetical protein
MASPPCEFNENPDERVVKSPVQFQMSGIISVPRRIFAKLLLASHCGAGPFNSESCMLKRVLIASLFIVTGSVASDARPSRVAQIPECNVTMPCDFSGFRIGRGGIAPYPQEQHGVARRVISPRSEIAEVNNGPAQVVGGRPAGCPRSFCGCGASLRVFGRIVPGLNLASNWLRFPRAAPAPGMVAARRGHVFVLEQHVEGDSWMAYDANSGGHATRIHARSLRGYAVVNPRGA